MLDECPGTEATKLLTIAYVHASNQIASYTREKSVTCCAAYHMILLYMSVTSSLIVPHGTLPFATWISGDKAERQKKLEAGAACVRRR